MGRISILAELVAPVKFTMMVKFLPQIFDLAKKCQSQKFHFTQFLGLQICGLPTAACIYVPLACISVVDIASVTQGAFWKYELPQTCSNMCIAYQHTHVRIISTMNVCLCETSYVCVHVYINSLYELPHFLL